MFAVIGAVLITVVACGGGSKEGKDWTSSQRPAKAAVTVETLSFVPPDNMKPITATDQDVALELSLKGATAGSGDAVPPPGVQVFKGGRDIGGVPIRVELIKSRFAADTPDAQFSQRDAKIPGAAKVMILETTFPQVSAKQMDIVIGTAAGPQYDIRYGAEQNSFDQGGFDRIVSTAQISTGGA
jgi:hypothetical protein